MKKIVFATNNEHKLIEIINAMQGKIEILGLTDIGFFVDIPETAETLEGNALIKSSTIYNQFGFNCFADDTGLEVEALNMQPGVYSARYGGEAHNHEKNIDKLLSELDGVENRKARFRTVISLIWDGREYFYEGIVNGVILKKRQGTKGFGYDPVFKPLGFDKSFAQMSLDEKNIISHRGIAIRKLIEFLRSVE